MGKIDLTGTGEIDTVWVTCKTINATSGSRTAIDVDIVPGMVLARDFYDHDGDGTPNFTRTASTNRSAQKCVVISVPASVNEFIDGSTTQRKGGKVKVAFSMAKCPRLYVESTTNIAVGDPLSPTNDQYYLVSDATAGLDQCAIAGEARTADDAGFIEGSFKSLM